MPTRSTVSMDGMHHSTGGVDERACVPGVKPGMAAVGLVLVTVMGGPPLRGTTVKV